MSWFSRRPPSCRTCGDEMRPMQYVDHYRRNGSAVVWRGWHCPRAPARDDPFDSGSGYKHDCFPPPPMAMPNGKFSKAAVAQHERMDKAWREHRPWQDAL
jgi:hypothetical protein